MTANYGRLSNCFYSAGVEDVLILWDSGLNRTAAAERWRNAYEFSIKGNRDIQFHYRTSCAQTFQNILGFAQQNITFPATVAEFTF